MDVQEFVHPDMNGAKHVSALSEAVADEVGEIHDTSHLCGCLGAGVRIFRGEVRIFAESLLNPAPARIERKVARRMPYVPVPRERPPLP